MTQSSVGNGDGGVCRNQVEVCAGACRCVCRVQNLGESQVGDRNVRGPGMGVALEGGEGAAGSWTLQVRGQESRGTERQLLVTERTCGG